MRLFSREKDLDAQLIIQMREKTTGILNCKVLPHNTKLGTREILFMVYFRQILETKILDTKNLHLTIPTGLMMTNL